MKGNPALPHRFGRRSTSSPTVPVAGFLLTLAAAFCLLLVPAAAASGPFAGFDGHWSGTGKLRPSNGAAERIRCDAHYRPIGQHEIKLELRCASDSYKIDLAGDFNADERDHISGSWTERTRGVSGSIFGQAQGDRLLVNAASPGFSAELLMVTRGRRQSISIDSKGGGQVVKAFITLNRR